MSTAAENALCYLDSFAEPPTADPVLEDASLDFIPDDPDELRQAVTDMAAHINLADWRFVKLVAAMERTRSWRKGGYCNLGNWLDHRCGLGPCAARERIRIGRALERLPCIDAAFRDGMISYSKVRAITRVATPETDAMLLAIAEGSSAARLESLVRTYERVGGSDRARASSEQRRSLSWYYEDGMVVLTAAVPAERGALVIKALQKVVDGRKDEREAHHESLLAGTCRRETVEPEDAGAQTQVAGEASDWLPPPVAEDLCGATESALAGEDFGTGAVRTLVAEQGAGVTEDKAVPAPAEKPAVDVSTRVSEETPEGLPDAVNGKNLSTRIEGAAMNLAGDVSAESEALVARLEFEFASTEQRFADALVDIAEHYLASGARGRKQRRSGQRYEVILTIDRNELAARQAGDGARYHVDTDWGIDEADARHIACDADLTEFIQDAGGNLLNYARRRRIVPARLLRALKLRDHNRCRFPGCSHQRHVEAHHVRHWIDGGETCMENLVTLCGAHHRLLHHGAFHIAIEDDDFVFTDRNGEVIEPALRPQFADVSGEFPMVP